MVRQTPGRSLELELSSALEAQLTPIASANWRLLVAAYGGEGHYWGTPAVMNLKRALGIVCLVAFSIWLGFEWEWRRSPAMFVLLVFAVPAAIVAGLAAWWRGQRKEPLGETKGEGDA